MVIILSSPLQLNNSEKIIMKKKVLYRVGKDEMFADKREGDIIVGKLIGGDNCGVIIKFSKKSTGAPVDVFQIAELGKFKIRPGSKSYRRAKKFSEDMVLLSTDVVDDLQEFFYVEVAMAVTFVNGQ